MTTKDELGQTTRGFAVIVHDVPKRGSKKTRDLLYPCSGCSYLTGKQALSTMETLKARGFRTTAYTETLGEPENLTLEEMRESVL